MSFSSTRGATGGVGPGLAARLPPRIWDNGEAAATEGGLLLPCRLGDDGEEAAMGPPASEKDGKRSDGGRSESAGGVLGLDGRTGLRR